MRPPEPRSRRQRPTKPPLTRTLIVTTALEIVRSHGLSALTMRALAKRLDTGAAALYVYFSDRQALIDAMIDTALADVDIPAAATPWAVRIESLAMSTLEALTRYPGLASSLVGRVPSATAVLRISEAHLAVLHDAGLDDATAALAVDALNAMVVAQAMEIGDFESLDGPAHLRQAEDSLARIDPGTFPHLYRIAGTAMGPSPLQRARWSIRTLIAGMSHP